MAKTKEKKTIITFTDKLKNRMRIKAGMSIDITLDPKKNSQEVSSFDLGFLQRNFSDLITVEKAAVKSDSFQKKLEDKTLEDLKVIFSNLDIPFKGSKATVIKTLVRLDNREEVEAAIESLITNDMPE